jgi:hypothetical protein
MATIGGIIVSSFFSNNEAPKNHKEKADNQESGQVVKMEAPMQEPKAPAQRRIEPIETPVESPLEMPAHRVGRGGWVGTLGSVVGSLFSMAAHARSFHPLHTPLPPGGFGSLPRSYEPREEDSSPEPTRPSETDRLEGMLQGLAELREAEKSAPSQSALESTNEAFENDWA